MYQEAYSALLDVVALDWANVCVYLHVCVHTRTHANVCMYLTSWVSTLLNYKSTPNCPHLDVGQLPSRSSYCTPRLASQQLPVSAGSPQYGIMVMQCGWPNWSAFDKFCLFSKIWLDLTGYKIGILTDIKKNWTLCFQEFRIRWNTLDQLFCHNGTRPYPSVYAV